MLAEQLYRAWSLTATPTWKKGVFFIRGEVSYTDLPDYTHFSFPGGSFGFGFGKTGAKQDQFRGLLEAGIVF